MGIRHFLIVLGTTVAILTGGAALAQTGGAENYPLPGDEVYPEGVAYQPSTGDFYVGSTSDGAVFRGNVSEPGTEAETFLAPGENGRAMAIGMKVDEAGMLFVAGGETGRMFVYDTSSGQLVDRFSNGADQTFVNDVALAPDGSAYFTDSANPELYRLVPTGGGYEFERFLDLEGTPIVYDEEFNLNGIVVTPDGRYLITIKSPTGQLFRIDTRTEEIVEIDTGDADLSNGDGLLLEGQTLYVVRNQNELIVPVELSADLTSGTAGEGFTNDSLRYPTTIAAYDGRLLAVNSQFDVRDSGGNPDLPFSVTSIPIPGAPASASASASASATASASAVPMPDTGGPPVAALLLGTLVAGALAAGYVAARGLQGQGRP